MNCATGDSLASAEAEASDKNHVLDALGKVATAMREKLGESLATIQKFDKPLDEATTSSLEALKAFSEGRRAQASVGDAPAIPLFKRAIELDPNFASAYLGLSVAYSNLGEAEQSNVYTRKAYELRDRVSEREKFRITADYYEYCTGDIEKAIQAFQQWGQAYPHESGAQVNIGVLEQYLGRYDKALPPMQEFLRMSPNSGIAYGNLMGIYISLNRLDEAKATYQEAMERKTGDIVALRSNMYWLAFLEGDNAEMEKQFAGAQGKEGVEDFLDALASDTEAFHGRLAKAREDSQRAVQFDQRSDLKETAALWQELEAYHEAVAGNAERAKQVATDGLGIASEHDSQLVAALVFGHAVGFSAGGEDCGRSGEALSRGHARQFLLASCDSRAEVALDRKNAAKAIEILKPAAIYELGASAPAYQRARARRCCRFMCVVRRIWRRDRELRQGRNFRR